METTNWLRRLWISMLVANILIPGLLGQKYSEEEYTGVEKHAFIEKPLKHDDNYGQHPIDQAAPSQQQQDTASSTTSNQLESTKLERIMKPNLGVFNPSPQVRFPETLSPPPMYPVYDEIKSSSLNFGEIHMTPYYYSGKYHGSTTPSHGRYYNHIPPTLQHPPTSYDQHHEGKRQYAGYDPVHGEEDAFQHSLAGPQTYYQQAPSGNSQGSQNLIKDKLRGPWKALVRALTTLLPVGLFLAALPPNIVTINSTAARGGRSAAVGDGGSVVEDEDELVEEEYPVLNLMGRFGISALDDPECESRIFCEISRLGDKPEGNVVQKLFWRVVNEAPDALTEIIGLKKLFKAARTGSCDTYRCEENDGNSR